MIFFAMIVVSLVVALNDTISIEQQLEISVGILVLVFLVEMFKSRRC